MSNKVVKLVTALRTDTLRLRWLLEDGSYFDQYVTCPPMIVVESRAKTADVDAASGSVSSASD